LPIARKSFVLIYHVINNMVKSSEKINRIEQNKTSLELIKIGSKAEGIKADGFSI